MNLSGHPNLTPDQLSLALAPLSDAVTASPPQPCSPTSTPASVPEADVSVSRDLEEQPAFSPPPERPELADWKAALRQDFERWLATLESIPELIEPEPEEPSAPDLYAFFEALAALSTESRKANRRTAEVFSQWSDALGQFQTGLTAMQTQLSELAAPMDEGLPREHGLALIEILDRAERLAVAFQKPSPRSWWPGAARWRHDWETQREGLDILREHIERFLKNEGIARLDVLGQPFNPATMSAIASEPSAQHPHFTVVEEIAPGYLCRGELLRAAHVKVSVRQEPSLENKSSN